jgi:hypothetical protein
MPGKTKHNLLVSAMSRQGGKARNSRLGWNVQLTNLWKCNALADLHVSGAVYKGLRVPGPHRKRHETNGRDGGEPPPAHVHLAEHPNVIVKPSPRCPSTHNYTFQVVRWLQTSRTREASDAQTTPPSEYLPKNVESPTCQWVKCHCLEPGKW